MFDDIFSHLGHHDPETQATDYFAADHLHQYQSAYGVEGHPAFAPVSAGSGAEAHGHFDFDPLHWPGPASHSPQHTAHPEHPAADAYSPAYAPAHHEATPYWSDGQPVPHYNEWSPAAGNYHGVGNPFGDAQYWQQQHANDCAVMAQTDVYNALTGHHLTEQQALNIVTQHGWYHDGTTLQDSNKLLNYFHIPTQEYANASIQDLYKALQHGDQVIVGLNANDIWFPHRDPVTGAPVEQAVAGHAVWVTGIEQAPNGSIKVILNDTGTPNGRMETVDAADFMNAWHDFSDFMIVAHAPGHSA